MISSLKLAGSLKEQSQIIWEYYLSRRLTNNFEPEWIHYPYHVVKKFISDDSLNDSDFFVLKEVIKSHLQKDATEVPIKTGFPNEGTRIMHDCWKAGSFTWIFMGRIFCENIFSYKSHVVISRKLPDEIYRLIDQSAPQTLYAAYELNKNSFIGPAVVLDQLLNQIDLEKTVDIM